MFYDWQYCIVTIMNMDKRGGEGALVVTDVRVIAEGAEPSAAPDVLSLNERPVLWVTALHKLGSFAAAAVIGAREFTRPSWTPVVNGIKELTRRHWDASYQTKADRAYTQYLVSIGVVPPSALTSTQ